MHAVTVEELDLGGNHAVTGVGLMHGSGRESLKRNRTKTLQLGLDDYFSDNDWKEILPCLRQNIHLTKLL